MNDEEPPTTHNPLAAAGGREASRGALQPQAPPAGLIRAVQPPGSHQDQESNIWGR